MTGDSTWSDVNDYSVVTRLDCGEVEFLFMGDAEKEAEADLQGDISAEILKVGHHGSGTSTSADFLNRVKPEAAIISVGKDNKYEHPAADTLNVLMGQGIVIIRTDEIGDIAVITDSKTYAIQAEKNRGQQE